MTSDNPHAERVAAYIDGFNLYHGIHHGGRRNLLWLDLQKLVSSLLNPGQQLAAVRYFTAHVRNDPAGQVRQQTYLKALSAHCDLVDIRRGRFQQRVRTCFSCRSSWTDYEEKESDVALAIALVADAARDVYDTAMIVSADSDMLPAIRELRRFKAGARVIAALPPNRRSLRLQGACDATISISIGKIRQAQLPETVMDGQYALTRPDYWKPAAALRPLATAGAPATGASP